MSMTEETRYAPRTFAGINEITQIGEGLLACTLPKERWTHEAHFAATAWLMRCHPEIDLPQKLPSIIARYNEAVGGQNTDTAGYHETLTQFYIRVVRAFLASRPGGEDLLATVNALVTSPLAQRGYPLSFWSRERLFSVPARRHWIEPDLTPLTVA